MKHEKQDRRSQRTQRLLRDALMSLLLERRYADVTVQDLLDRADIGRSTFYAHYWDKEDLLASEIERMLDALDRQMAESAHGETDLLPVLGLFRHVEEFYSAYLALGRGEELEIALDAMRKRLCEVAECRLRAMAPAGADIPALSVTVAAQAAVGGVLALLQWWVEAGLPIPAEHLATYCRKLIWPGVRQFAATSGRAGGALS